MRSNTMTLKAIKFLHLFSSQSSRLVLVRSETVNFTTLINLRCLILKYGSPEQFNSIRPQYFPKGEILHIYAGNSKSIFNNTHKDINAKC